MDFGLGEVAQQDAVVDGRWDTADGSVIIDSCIDNALV